MSLTTRQLLAMGLDPSLIMGRLGFDPDPWQREVLRSEDDRLLLLTNRQAGKSTTAGALGVQTAVCHAGSLVIAVSPSQRQSSLLFRKIAGFWRKLGRPHGAVEESATSLMLGNDSWIVSLPGNPDTIRGFSGPRLILADEAALIPDGLLAAILPMLAVSKGRLVALSTPMGKRGWYCDAWHDPAGPWKKIRASAWDCPRIDRRWLEEQRLILGPRWFSQEFECEFLETVDQVFSDDVLAAAFTSDKAPIFA